jgi:flagellar biosynthetic protein FliP
MKKNIFRLIILLLVLVHTSASYALADPLSFDIGDGNLTSKVINGIALITILSLAPSILVMVTSFTRIVVVFSFLRTALGLQQSPPNMVLISLALFLTGFIMAPTLETSYKQGIEPLMSEKLSLEEAWPKISDPFKTFMLNQTRNKDLALFTGVANIDLKNVQEAPLKVVVPAFIISELHRAFEIGFLIFIPFLIIDILISSILMAMGMMMLPPVMISLPFKLIFFVIVDGWYMICGSLIKSFGA